jgi:hypothetical protein
MGVDDWTSGKNTEWLFISTCIVEATVGKLVSAVLPPGSQTLLPGDIGLLALTLAGTKID